MTIYFTSDTHFGHANIINLCNRPFQSEIEMNFEMAKRWNENVRDNDEIYHLGDFAFKGIYGLRILEQLKGRKHLLIGNHDSKEIIESSSWESVQEYKEIKYNHRKFVLFHYPIASWNGMFRDAIHLFGHTHGNYEATKNSYDVGVDTNNFTPIPIDDILAYLAIDERPVSREGGGTEAAL